MQSQKPGHDKIVAYASQSLNEAEKRYSQIERECLAVHFGCVRFQMYLLGKNFTVYTDHKPLVPMLNNAKKNSPFRVERIRLVKLSGKNISLKSRKIRKSDAKEMRKRQKRSKFHSDHFQSGTFFPISNRKGAMTS